MGGCIRFKWFAVLTLTFAMAAAALPAQTLAQNDVANLHVFSCQTMSGPVMPRTDDIGLLVRFRNDGSQTIREIVWRAKYGPTSFDVRDEGTFTPGTRIDNFDLAEQGSSHLDFLKTAVAALLLAGHVPSYPNKLMKSTIALPNYLSTADPDNCSIVRVTFADGTSWLNPDLDQQVHPFAMSSGLRPEIPADASITELPIDVEHCVLEFYGKSALSVTFRNTSPVTADRIVIRANFKTSGIDFVDQGVFASDTSVKHILRNKDIPELRGQAYVSLDDPRDCVVVSVHYADGSAWQNAQLPATPAPLPTPVTDSIPPNQRFHWARTSQFTAPAPTEPSPVSSEAR